MEEQTSFSRRGFLKTGVFSTLGVSTLGCIEKLSAFETNHLSGGSKTNNYCTHHDLLTTKFVSKEGEIMDDGRRVPERHDGMACFDLPNGNFMLIRNHENALLRSFKDLLSMSPNAYDRVAGGGTSNVELDRNLNVVSHYMSLQGTMVNCSGGKTPWNTWLTCEEYVDSSWAPTTKRHGYVFEVNPTDRDVQPANPLKNMGRFKHEAVAVDDQNQVLYLTEDKGDSCIYRYIPDNYPNLEKGKLQALKIVGNPKLKTGDKRWGATEILDVEWVDINDPDPKRDTVRDEGQKKGAAIFSRGEGIACFGQDVYWTCTNGGRRGYGQIFHYAPTGPDSGTIRLVYEPDHPRKMSNPDNICVNKFGDLLVCEDGGYQGKNRIFGVRPDGKLYWIASNPHSEWTGVCLSDDESVMFCNIQGKGVTVCFTGEFDLLREQTV